MAHNIYHIQDSSQDINVLESDSIGVIESFIIDTSDMPTTGASRSIQITSNNDCKFYIQVVQKSSSSSVLDKFYNFETNEFQFAFNTNTNLYVELSSGSFNRSINFPSGVTSYVVKLITSDALKTRVSDLIISNDHVISKTISQTSNTTLTIAPTSSDTSFYKTLPTDTRIASAATTSTTSKVVSFDIENTESDAKGFGLRQAKTNFDEKLDVFFETTETVDGAVSPSDANGGLKVKVDDLTDLGVNMTIVGVSSGSLSGTPIITAIDTASKTLTISSAQTFSDDITLTIRAIGQKVINTTQGMSVKFSKFVITPEKLTKTVRTDSSSATINLNGTYGISGGNHVTISGANVNNATTNTVDSVSASSTAGSIVMTLDQTGVTTGSQLSFAGSHQKINFKFIYEVAQQPSTTKIINIDLDNLITVGTVS
jgi:hypothetical protein